MKRKLKVVGAQRNPTMTLQDDNYDFEGMDGKLYVSL